MTGPMPERRPFGNLFGDKLMSDDEIDLHKRTAMKMGQGGKSLAEIKAYMDHAGVPSKKKVDYSPGITKDFILGAVTSAMHGASFGFDDEAIGSLYGLVTGSTAQAGRDVYRQRLQAFHDQNPGTDLALQIAGGVATGGVIGAARKAIAPKAMEWMTSLPGAIKAMGAGAAGGGAYAAGDATGGLQERAGAIPGGAATGAVLGGAMTAGVVGVGQVLKPITRKLPVFKNLTASADEVGDDVILQDLMADKANLPDLVQRAKAAALKGQPVTLGDLAGENTVGRMASIQAIPGVGKQELKEGLIGRQSGSGDRLVEWLGGKTKLGLANVEQTRNGLLGARALQAEGLYDDAYQLSAPMTDKLKTAFSNPDFKKAWNEARQELRTKKGIDVPAMPGKGVPGGEVLPTELPISGLDWTKRYIDKQVRSGFNGSGWDKGKASGLSEQLRDVLTEIDELVPAYGVARKTYRGDSEVIDALDEGRKFLSTPADMIALKVQGYKSQAEREAAKLGFIEDIRDAIYNKKQKAPDVAQTVLGGTEMKRRIQAVFGPDADDFLDRIRIEARFAEVLRGTAGGSRTTPLAQTIDEWKQETAGAVGNLLAGRPGTAMVQLAKGMGASGVRSHQEKVANAMSQRYQLGMNDPAELIGYLLNLQSRKPRTSWTPRIAGALGGQSVAGQGY